jgi:hypothetical protein
MCFLANNVTVLGLSVGGDGEETIITATQEQEMKRISANRNLYQVLLAFIDLEPQSFNLHRKC